MQRPFSYEALAPYVYRRSSPYRRSNIYDFRNTKSSFDASRENSLDMLIHVASSRNSLEQQRKLTSLKRSFLAPSEHLSFLLTDDEAKQKRYRSEHSLQNTKHIQIHEPHEIVEGLQLSKEQKEMYKFMPQKDQMYEQDSSSCEQGSNKNVSHFNKAGGQQESQKSTCEGLPDNTFQDLTVHGLFELCENHFSVIDTCTILQQVISEELMKQGKLDDDVSLNLTEKSKRLHEQVTVIETLQAPNWVSTALKDLGTLLSERAHAHTARATILAEECQTIQRSLDNHDKIKEKDGISTTEAEAMVEESGKSSTNLMKPYDSGSKAGDITFSQTIDDFERVHKPWMRLTGLMEYQQEQLDSTIALISQVENEIGTISKKGKRGNVARKAQCKGKDLQTKKESLEARKEHLEIQIKVTKIELEDFELQNRDNILKVITALCQHKDRFDRCLRQQFQLLKDAALTEPPLRKPDCQKKEDYANGEEASEEMELCVTGTSPSSCTLTSASTFGIHTFQGFGSNKKCAGDTPSKETYDFQKKKHSPDRFITNTQKITSKSCSSHIKEPKFLIKPEKNTTSPLKLILDKSFNAFQTSATKVCTEPSNLNPSPTNKRPHSVLVEDKTTEDDPKADGQSESNNNLVTIEKKFISHLNNAYNPQTKPYDSENKELNKMVLVDKQDENISDKHELYFQNNTKKEVNLLGVSCNRSKRRRSEERIGSSRESTMSYFRTRTTAVDILSMKEKRATYFINKYAGGMHVCCNCRAPLTKSWNSVPALKDENKEDKLL